MAESGIYASLLPDRITRILMICSNYDAFLMEEDGRIESRVYNEFIELNMTHPPTFIWANSSEAAKQIIHTDPNIDLIICMYNETDQGIFPLASGLKEEGCTVPFVLLMHYSKTIRKKVTSQLAQNGVDYVFSWHGNADLVLAIIKLLEDQKNAENDILGHGVQAILLAEDSIRYYSTYLPELYKLIFTQSSEFLREALNEDQKRNRKRSRPKVLLATNYTDAIELYDRYRANLLGVITDVGMIMHAGDSPKTEKLDAGIDLVNHIRSMDPSMPVLMQSSQGSMAEVASSLGVRFIKKYSRTLFLQLSDVIKEEFGFGDFVFKDDDGIVYGRCSNLRELESIADQIPDNVLTNNASRNMFSKWLYARGLFALASRFRKEHHVVASEMRDFLKSEIRAFHKSVGRGVIAEFNSETYERFISFARMGEGSLGGKARGLAFLNKLIDKYDLAARYDGISISIPRSVVVNTGYFDEFIEMNGLQYIIDSELSDDEILSEFVASRLPEALISQLRAYLKTVTTPLAIRSSSKLEDSNYQPFAGVYSTYMIPLVENKDQMLRMLDKAIKSVYASAFYNGSRNYIQSTGNLHSEEKMAVVIQNICGSNHKGYFYPLISGVARSINFYPIANEKVEDGIVNVVLGLGKGVVEGEHTLRFSPKFPKKILQLSQPEIAMRDTQTRFYALDVRPGSFKISRNEGVNLAYLPVTEIIGNHPNSGAVISTYDAADGRIVPGTAKMGPRIVSFDWLLKYEKFPLAKALREIMGICRDELQCEVEMEFAADLSDDGSQLSLKLLQVRPISQYSDNSNMTLASVEASINKVLLRSDKALGNGYFAGMRNIVFVSPQAFDSSKTEEIAAEIQQINLQFKNADEGYLLIGPGRWGSSDHNLGIPVSWSDISEAKMIVEYGMQGFQVEPSQGTHFFQNITSLGVGYLTIDLVSGDGSLDIDEIESLPVSSKGKYTTVYTLSSDMSAFIDRSSNKAVLGY